MGFVTGFFVGFFAFLLVSCVEVGVALSGLGTPESRARASRLDSGNLTPEEAREYGYRLVPREGRAVYRPPGGLSRKLAPLDP